MFGYRLAGMKPRYFSTGAASLLRQCGRLPGAVPRCRSRIVTSRTTIPTPARTAAKAGSPGSLPRARNAMPAMAAAAIEPV